MRQKKKSPPSRHKAQPAHAAPAEAPAATEAPPSAGADAEGGPAREARDAKEPRDTKERKERVIHTRVPAVLEEELKRFAENLRVPVSNLIRTILEDAVAVADRASGKVEEELRSAVEHLSGERKKLTRKLVHEKGKDPLDGVLGFQALRMNLSGECGNCGAAIAAGADAFIGLTDQPGRRLVVCARCVSNQSKGERR